MSRTWIFDGKKVPGNRPWISVVQTAFFRLGEALKRTVLPAFTLMAAPVRGLRPLRALVLRTLKVPKLGKVNFPVFFSSFQSCPPIKNP